MKAPGFAGGWLLKRVFTVRDRALLVQWQVTRTLQQAPDRDSGAGGDREDAHAFGDQTTAAAHCACAA